MAVGPNFQDQETQAAIAAQAAQAQPADEAVNVEPTTETPAAEAVEPVEAVETPQAETPETDESAVSPNMDEGVTPMTPEQVSAALKEAGFSESDITKEYAENRKISDETIAKLKEHFPADVVDKSIADMAAKFEAELETHDADVASKNEVIEKNNNFIYGQLAGGDVEKGKENLKILSEWARKNLDEKQLKLINKKLASGDQDIITDGLTQAVAAWKKGQRKPMMEGSAAATANATAAPAFEPLSRDEFIKILSTEKYQKDPEYAEKVDSRRRKTMETEGAMTPEFSHLRPPV